MLFRSPGSVSKSWTAAFGQSVERALQIEFGVRSLLICVAAYTAAAAVLLWPRAFFVAYLLNDTFIYAEAGYRLAFGQVPGLGATSALGLFAYAPYALAFRLLHDAAEAVPVSFAIFGGIVLVLASIIALTRLSAAIGMIVVVACSLVMLAPFVIGAEIAGEVMSTAANTYNRFGFVLVLLAALLAIEPRSRTVTWRGVDLVWAIAATVLAYYTKMPFGLAVAGLVGFWLVAMRHDLIGTLLFAAGCALVGFGVEKLWPGLNLAYIHEMAFAAQASGGTLRPFTLAMISIRTAPEILAFAAAPLIAVFLSQRADWRDAVFAVLLICGSFLLLSQSAQGLTLVTPVAIAVIAVTRLAIMDATEAQRIALWVSLVATVAGFAALATPAAFAIGKEAAYAGRTRPIQGMPANYRSLRVIDDADVAAFDAAMTGSAETAKTFTAARVPIQRFSRDPLFENEYVHTIAKLSEARELCGTERDRTAVLDFANVSASLFGHPPAGAWAYLDWGRSFSPSAFVPAPRMFTGVGCLFEPKLPQNPASVAGIWTVYGDYLHDHYRLAGETPFWRVLVRQPE
jgi:hypothetical protein